MLKINKKFKLSKRLKNELKDNILQLFAVFTFVIFAFEFLFPHIALASVIEPKEADGDSVERIMSAPRAYAVDQIKSEQELSPQLVVKERMRIIVTAYSSTVDQTDSTPFTTSIGTRVRDGIIAANFLPIGTQVRFPEYFGDKVFVVEDRMNPRYYRRVDIWMPTRKEAMGFGVRYLEMEIIEKVEN